MSDNRAELHRCVSRTIGLLRAMTGPYKAEPWLLDDCERRLHEYVAKCEVFDDAEQRARDWLAKCESEESEEPPPSKQPDDQETDR